MPTAPKTFRIVGAETKREAWSHKGKTTTQRGYGWDHQQARARLLAAEPICRECRKSGKATLAKIADHIIPLAEGGRRDASNLQPLCRSCSDAKTAKEALRGIHGAR